MAKHKPTPPDTEAAPEGYTVLARRYRPQTFAEVVGQEPIARALVNALQGNRVAHAYLFTGARGVGKTSIARILAKALNCEKGPTPTPCGVCPACQSIATGEDIDVLEIDGASNRGIDEVRRLRETVGTAPARSRYKIFIIDEVHMLTREAFNALLKTLEEPPPRVKFIFATTDVQRIPLTILSRCQRFDFPGIPLARIVEHLQAIVGREGLQADEEALQLVARRAGGSMRDAQSLLDQLLAFGGGRLTAEQVHHLLGTAGDDRIAALAAAVLAQDPKKALDLLDDAVVGGLQLGELLDQLIAYWRDLMVVHCAGPEGAKGGLDLSVPARHLDTLARQAKALQLDTILAGLDVLSATRGRLRGSNHGRTLVEMALVRLGRLADLVPLAQLAHHLARRPDPGAGPRAPTAPAPAAAPRVLPPEGVKKKPLSGERQPPETRLAQGAETTRSGTSAQPAPDGPADLTPETLPAVWAQTLSVVGTLLASDLQKAGLPAIFRPNTLVLRFPAAYNQAREFCQDPGRLAKVEEALRKTTGRSWALRVESGGGSPAVAPAAEGVPAEVTTPPRPRRDYREEAAKLPLIKRALEVLGATLQRVDEGFGDSQNAPLTPDPSPRRGEGSKSEDPSPRRGEGRDGPPLPAGERGRG